MAGNNVLLTERDLHLFRELGEAKLLDREQIQVVTGIHSINRANDRLHKLHGAGLLRRYFVGTIAGGRKALYALSKKSADEISLEKFWKFQRADDELLIGDGFAAHQLAVNQCWISAKYCAPSGVQFLRWLRFQEMISHAIPLMPDGYLEVATSTTHGMFIEVDLGTETSRVWQKKVALYLKLATSGEFQKRFQQPRFRVLVIAHSERRLKNLRRVVRQQTTRIFYFTDLNTIDHSGLFAALWLRPEGDEPVPLF